MMANTEKVGVKSEASNSRAYSTASAKKPSGVIGRVQLWASRISGHMSTSYASSLGTASDASLGDR